MAIALLSLVGLMVALCAGAWTVMQRSAELAAGSLRSQYIPMVEQSMLAPETKTAAVRQLETLRGRLESKQIDPSNARLLMGALVKLPIVQWGDIDAVLVQVNAREGFDQEARAKAGRTIERLKRGAEMDRITSYDFENVLIPVTVVDKSPRGRHFDLAATDDAIRETLKRAEQAVLEAKIPDEAYVVEITDLIRTKVETFR